MHISRDFERIQQCERDPKDKTEPTRWAELYKNWISNLLKTNETLIQGKIQKIIETIQANKGRMVSLKKPDEPNKYGKAFLALRSLYPVSHFQFDHTALLSFPERNIGIRDDAGTDLCTRATPSGNCVERTIVRILHVVQNNARWSLTQTRSIVYIISRTDLNFLPKHAPPSHLSQL